MFTDFANAPQSIRQQANASVQFRIVVLGDDADARHSLAMQNESAFGNPSADVAVFNKAAVTLLDVEEFDGAGMQATVKYLQVAVRLSGEREFVSSAQVGHHGRSSSIRQRWARSPYAADNSSVAQMW